jgi:hypothetical protein
MEFTFLADGGPIVVFVARHHNTGIGHLLEPEINGRKQGVPLKVGLLESIFLRGIGKLPADHCQPGMTNSS